MSKRARVPSRKVLESREVTEAVRPTNKQAARNSRKKQQHGQLQQVQGVADAKAPAIETKLSDPKRYDNPYVDKLFRVEQPAEDPNPPDGEVRRKCTCCKQLRAGECGRHHRCRKECYVRRCKLATAPPFLPLHALPADEVSRVRRDSLLAWARLLLPLHEKMLAMRNLGTKPLCVTADMSALHWAIGMADAKAAPAWSNTFASVADLDVVFGPRWASSWLVATQPMRVAVLADPPIRIKLHQDATCRADHSAIPADLVGVALSLALQQADKLVKLVWRVSLYCTIERTVP